MGIKEGIFSYGGGGFFFLRFEVLVEFRFEVRGGRFLALGFLGLKNRRCRDLRFCLRNVRWLFGFF